MGLNKKKSLKSVISKGSGYLFCNHCGGYYKLKKDESPRDFVKCECGNPLEFCKNKKELDLRVYNLERNKEAFNQFEDRIMERRESLKDIFPNVEIDDDFIQEMQEEEELWDILDNESNKNTESDINNQKKYLDIILEEERLMMNIKGKKTSVKNQTFMEKIVSFYNRTDPLILLGTIIIIVIVVVFLTVLYP